MEVYYPDWGLRGVRWSYLYGEHFECVRGDLLSWCEAEHLPRMTTSTGATTHSTVTDIPPLSL